MLLKRTLILAIVAFCAGCSVAVRAELLNPLNKSGRVEHSEPVKPAAPAPVAPAPTPVPEASPSPTALPLLEFEVSPLDEKPQRIAARRVR